MQWLCESKVDESVFIVVFRIFCINAFFVYTMSYKEELDEKLIDWNMRL
jgi:hypothetical protein